MLDFMQTWTFFIIMIVLLIALIGVYFYLRNQPEED